MNAARPPHRLAISTSLALLLVFVAGTHAPGCGGQAPQKRTSSPASSFEDSEAYSEEGDDGDDREARIARLFSEIGDARVQLDLSREPGGDDIAEAHGVPMPQSEDTQPTARPKSRTCKDICRISEKICDNAELICELADDLGGDPWAMEKCDSGKASCNEASKRCSGCVDTE